MQAIDAVGGRALPETDSGRPAGNLIQQPLTRRPLLGYEVSEQTAAASIRTEQCRPWPERTTAGKSATTNSTTLRLRRGCQKGAEAVWKNVRGG